MRRRIWEAEPSVALSEAEAKLLIKAAESKPGQAISLFGQEVRTAVLIARRGYGLFVRVPSDRFEINGRGRDAAQRAAKGNSE